MNVFSCTKFCKVNCSSTCVNRRLWKYRFTFAFALSYGCFFTPATAMGATYVNCCKGKLCLESFTQCVFCRWTLCTQAAILLWTASQFLVVSLTLNSFINDTVCLSQKTYRRSFHVSSRYSGVITCLNHHKQVCWETLNIIRMRSETFKVTLCQTSTWSTFGKVTANIKR